MNKVFSFNLSFDLAAVVTLVFLVLKLTHVIDWAWVWVFAPLWIQLIITVCFLLLIHIYRKRR